MHTLQPLNQNWLEWHATVRATILADKDKEIQPRFYTGCAYLQQGIPVLPNHGDRLNAPPIKQQGRDDNMTTSGAGAWPLRGISPRLMRSLQAWIDIYRVRRQTGRTISTIVGVADTGGTDRPVLVPGSG